MREHCGDFIDWEPCSMLPKTVLPALSVEPSRSGYSHNFRLLKVRSINRVGFPCEGSQLIQAGAAMSLPQAGAVERVVARSCSARRRFGDVRRNGWTLISQTGCNALHWLEMVHVS